MALIDTRVMCGGRDDSRYLKNTLDRTTARNQSKSRTSGMASESDWIKHRKSSVFTAQVIHSAPSFKPWSSIIPIGYGYHEFL